MAVAMINLDPRPTKTSSSPFLRLPAEVRNAIYRQVLGENVIILAQGGSQGHHRSLSFWQSPEIFDDGTSFRRARELAGNFGAKITFKRISVHLLDINLQIRHEAQVVLLSCMKVIIDQNAAVDVVLQCLEEAHLHHSILESRLFSGLPLRYRPAHVMDNRFSIRPYMSRLIRHLGWSFSTQRSYFDYVDRLWERPCLMTDIFGGLRTLKIQTGLRERAIMLDWAMLDSTPSWYLPLDELHTRLEAIARCIMTYTKMTISRDLCRAAEGKIMFGMCTASAEDRSVIATWSKAPTI